MCMICQADDLQEMSCFIFKRKKAWHFMCMICQADDSEEMSYFHFEK